MRICTLIKKKNILPPRSFGTKKKGIFRKQITLLNLLDKASVTSLQQVESIIPDIGKVEKVSFLSGKCNFCQSLYLFMINLMAKWRYESCYESKSAVYIPIGPVGVGLLPFQSLAVW